MTDVTVSTASLSEDQLRRLVAVLTHEATRGRQDPGMRGFWVALAVALRGEVRRRDGVLACLELDLLQDEDDDEGALVSEYQVPPGWVIDGPAGDATGDAGGDAPPSCPGAVS